MRFPDEVIIDPEKLSDYLLLPRPRNDKAGFLARAGFRREESARLGEAIHAAAAGAPAIEDGYNEYGTFLRQDATLTGPNGSKLNVVLVWIRLNIDGSTRFVTLKPRSV